jgi:hypothetical protein
LDPKNPSLSPSYLKKYGSTLIDMNQSRGRDRTEMLTRQSPLSAWPKIVQLPRRRGLGIFQLRGRQASGEQRE